MKMGGMVDAPQYDVHHPDETHYDEQLQVNCKPETKTWPIILRIN
jgi:hypothetical protein